MTDNISPDLPAPILARVEEEAREFAQGVWHDYATPELRAFVAIDPAGLGTAIVALTFIAQASATQRKMMRCVRQPLVRLHEVRDAGRERMKCDALSGSRAA